MGERAPKVNQPRRAETPAHGGPKAATNAKRLSSRSAAPAVVEEVLRSQGQPLDPPTRGLMETRFGHDFSRVGVHTDARAAEAASTINARAFTLNHNIVFGAGEYAPRTHAGRWLISHELAHVVQQTGGVAALDAPQRLGLSLASATPAMPPSPRRRAPPTLSCAAASLSGRRRSTARPSSAASPRRKASAFGGRRGVEKAREEVEKLFAAYGKKKYKTKGGGDEFDPEALEDAAAIKAALTSDGRKYLRSEAGLSTPQRSSGSAGRPRARTVLEVLAGGRRLVEVEGRSLGGERGVKELFKLIEPLLDKTYNPPAPETQAETEAGDEQSTAGPPPPGKV